MIAKRDIPLKVSLKINGSNLELQNNLKHPISNEFATKYK